MPRSEPRGPARKTAAQFTRPEVDCDDG